LNCVTYSPFHLAGSPSQRTKEVVRWTGVVEEIKYETRGNAPLIHRRIVFTSRASITGTALQFFADGAVGRRGVFDADDLPIAVVTSLFTERSQDLTDSFVAPVNKKNVDLLSDDVYTISTAGNGIVRMSRYWTKLDQEMAYADDGDRVGTSPWCSSTSVLGNVYVCDIFANRENDADVASAQVSSRVTAYWKE
jgi:hypothetical protein